MRLGKPFLLFALLLSASAGVPRADADDDRTPTPAEFRGTGVIVAILPPPSALHATRPVIVIHHDPIVPLMPDSMEMPFLVASTALVANLGAGDHIAFTLRETSDALLVVKIERTSAAR